MVIVVAAVLWANRWHLGRTAVTIADPIIRSWVSDAVLKSSDSVYHLAASTIRVDDAQRRLAIDTIILTTDDEANRRLARPHPALTMRFSNCAVTGINLAALSAGQGLHAVHAGCDSVSVIERTLTVATAAGAAESSDTSGDNFLRFQGKVSLPGSLPYIAVDTIAFPHVHVSFDLLGADGRRSSLAVDSIGVELDSLRIDPREKVARRRPLFSRDITVRLDRFEGSTNSAAHISLRHLRANLELGTGELDSLGYEPAPGPGRDSTGFSALRAGHVRLERVDWRAFLLNGDVRVGRLGIDTIAIRIVAPDVAHARLLRDVSTRHAANTLRDAGRHVRLDSMTVTSLSVVESSAHRRDSVVTTVQRLTVAGLAFGPRAQDWTGPFPVGRIRLGLDALVRRTANVRLTVDHGELSAADGTINITGLRSEPPGNDAAFIARYPYRKSRFSLRMPRVALRGADLSAYLEQGSLRARALEAHGLVIDVLNDKGKPVNPQAKVRRTPQQVMRDIGVTVTIDSLAGDGLVTYRERDPKAAAPGTLTFGALRLHGTNFSNDPANRASFRLIGDARLMGEGAMHVEWTVPLGSRGLDMQWRGSLGAMKASALNPFLKDAVGMRFQDGVIDGVTWDAAVKDGLSRGKMEPRWHGLTIDLPGIARHDGSIVGGLKRGLAKFAANAFGIRSDDDTLGGHHARDASITHQWTKSETLPQFIWLQLRDPLLLILKR